MNQPQVVLVACAARKRSSASPAKDLYVSTQFSAARRFAELSGGRWFILSALHGLVDPEAVLEPYDKTLNGMPIHNRRQWAAVVLEQLQPIVSSGDVVCILAGRYYREFLVPPLRARGIIVQVPLVGLGGNGKQTQWLQRQNASANSKED